MVSTRSRLATTIADASIVEPLQKKTRKSPVKGVLLPGKVPTLERKVTDLENHLSHIEVPVDFELPANFVEKHTPAFIDGVKYILKVDSTLYRPIVCKDFPLFSKNPVIKLAYPDDPILGYWYSLVSLIISQQVSGAAAKSIESKFRTLYDGDPTPSATLKLSFEQLRGAGLLNKKVEYVQSLSEHFSNPENELAKLSFYEESLEEKIIEEMVKLKGIGPWSAKMFLVFTLGKINVFAHDDLGVARGAYRYLLRRSALLDRVKREVKLSEDLLRQLQKKSKFAASKGKRDWTPHHDVYVQQLGKFFEPYQTIVMLVLWRLSATNTDVLEGTNESNKNQN